MGTENNGYLDNDQTIVSFGVREQRMSFQELLDEDPSLMLYKWRKLRRSAKNTSVGCAIAGAGGAVLGVWTGAIPLLIAGMGVAALSGWMTKHHSEGILAIENESGILDRCRPVLGLLSQLEERGANRSDLVSLYERIVRGAIANRLDAGDPQQLKEFFEREIQQSNVVSGLLGKEQGLGIASTQLPAPQLVSTPESQAIGANTQFGAIAATAVEVDDLAADDWATPLVSGDRTQITTSAALQSRLKSECPELLKLVKSAPIRLVGLQRTGKSTFARKLALLRAILLPGHRVMWSTPHFEGDNPVPSQLNPFGCSQKGKDYRAIEQVWSGTQNQIDRGKQLNLTIVWDEFGGYGDGFNDPELLGASLRSLLRESTKHGYFPILVAHGDQAGFYPGVKNILGTLKESTVKVETIGEAIDDFGTMAPTGGLKILWLDGSQVTLNLPDWLTVDLLLGLLPAMPQAPVQVASPVDEVAIASVSDEEEAPHHSVDESRLQSQEAIKRVRAKVAKKLKSLEGEWTPIGAVSTALFSTKEDRESAKKIIEASISKGILNSESRDSQNGTKVLFVRINPDRLANNKSN